LGFIYLIRSGDDYVYKIGYSKNTKKRKKEHDTGNPNELTILHEFESNHNRKVETILHQRYKLYRIKGEWFELPMVVVNEFMIICSAIETNLDALRENPFI